MNMKHYNDADGLYMVLMRLDEWDEHERLADERIAALEADLAAARAERDTLWAYVSSGMTITNHEEYCEVCGHNDAPCAEKKRLEAENMRAFDAVMKIVAK